MTLTRRSLITAAACGLLLACAGKKPPPELVNRCPADRPGCQIEVVFKDVGLGERVARLDGRLTANQTTATYLFTATAGETLRLTLAGPPMTVVLTRPDGLTEGPGLPSELVLVQKGKHILRLAADTKVADPFGEFQLEMRLIRAP